MTGLMGRLERLEAKFTAGRALDHEAVIRAVHAVVPRWQDRMGAPFGTDAEPDAERQREFHRRVWDELRRSGYDVPGSHRAGRNAG